MKANIFIVLAICLICFASGQLDDCTSTCNAGHYCKDDNCIPCSIGSYMEVNSHSYTECVEWTKSPDINAVVVKNGSSTSDVIWGCQVGFKKIIMGYNVWACESITSTTSTTLSTSSQINYTLIEAISSTSEVSQVRKDETDINIVTIILPVAAFVVGMIVATYFYYKRKRGYGRQISNDSNSLLEANVETSGENLIILFNTVFEVIGLAECKQLFQYIADPENLLVSVPNFGTKKECIDHFICWKSKYPELNHVECIVSALKKREFKLPKDMSTVDAATVHLCLQNAKKLNNAFVNSSRELCQELNPHHIDRILMFINMKNYYDNIKKQGHIKQAFCYSLGKWGYKYPYEGNKGEWKPLTKLKNFLIELELFGIYGNFDNLFNATYKVLQELKINDISNNGVTHLT